LPTGEVSESRLIAFGGGTLVILRPAGAALGLADMLLLDPHVVYSGLGMATGGLLRWKYGWWGNKVGLLEVSSVILVCGMWDINRSPTYGNWGGERKGE